MYFWRQHDINLSLFLRSGHIWPTISYKITMKALIVLSLLSLMACKESDCDNKLKEVVRLDKELKSLKGLPTYNRTVDMKIARTALYLSVAKNQYNDCVNGE